MTPAGTGRVDPVFLSDLIPVSKGYLPPVLAPLYVADLVGQKIQRKLENVEFQGWSVPTARKPAGSFLKKRL